MKKIVVTIPDKMAAFVREEASMQGIPQAAFVRQCILVTQQVSFADRVQRRRELRQANLE